MSTEGSVPVDHSVLRRFVGRLYAFRYRIQTGGRVRGAEFILRKPSLVRVRGGGRVKIGEGVVIEHGARIVAHADLVIGDGVYVGKNSTLIAFASLSIGDRVLIGENVSIHTEDHGPVGHRDKFRCSAVSIGPDSWIGAGTVVLRGSEIGGASTIGANSVVRGSIPPGVLAAGAPASVRRQLD